jgi:hypothetical protein
VAEPTISPQFRRNRVVKLPRVDSNHEPAD